MIAIAGVCDLSSQVAHQLTLDVVSQAISVVLDCSEVESLDSMALADAWRTWASQWLTLVQYTSVVLEGYK